MVRMAASSLYLIRLGQRRRDAGDLVARTAVQRGEGAAARLGQRQLLAPAVAFRDRRLDQPPFAEASQGAAEIAGVEAEVAAQIAGGQTRAVRQFVEDPAFRQRELAVEQTLVQGPDMAGDEAIEAANGFDAGLEL